MSGGHFNYDCFRVDSIADDIQHEIDNNNVTDEYGYATNASPECINKIQKAQKVIEQAGKLAKEIEWFYSGDHGEESVIELIDDIMDEYK